MDVRTLVCVNLAVGDGAGVLVDAGMILRRYDCSQCAAAHDMIMLIACVHLATVSGSLLRPH